jgi:hypothetical protein
MDDGKRLGKAASAVCIVVWCAARPSIDGRQELLGGLHFVLFDGVPE